MVLAKMSKILVSVLMGVSFSAIAAVNDVGILAVPKQMAPAGVSALVGTGTFDGTELTMDNRLFRDAVPSVCEPMKGFPGVIAGTYAYRTHTYYNNGPAQCVTVSFDVGTCDTNVHLTAYAGSFNPADLSQNYLGDVGSSTTQSFSFMAPANSAVILMAQDNNGAAARCTYNFTSDQLSASSVAPAPIPTLSEWGMIILSSLMALGAFVTLRRRMH